MSLRLSICLLVLITCGCVARDQQRVNPSQQRFESLWAQSVDWDDALVEMRVHVQPPDAPAHTTALFWPEHRDKPGLDEGELVGVADAARWRSEYVLGRSYRVELSPDSEGQYGRLALPDASYAWALPTGISLDDNRVTLKGDGIRLPADAVRARLVFSLRAEPIPTRLYQHGSEVLVARWGAAFEPRAIEIFDSDGESVFVFQNESGPG